MGEFDVVIAMGVVHHIDEDEALHLFRAAATVLAPGGGLVTLGAAFTVDMSRAARWVVSRDRGRSVLSPQGYEALARTAFGTVHTAVHHDLLRIPYTHVFVECTNPLP